MFSISNFITAPKADLAVRRKAPVARRGSFRVVAHGGVGGSGGPQYPGKDKPFGSQEAPWRKKLILDDPDQADPENAGRSGGKPWTPPAPTPASSSSSWDTPSAPPPSNDSWGSAPAPPPPAPSGGAGYQDGRAARGPHLDQQDLQIDHPDYQHRHAEQDADEPLIDAEEFEHRCSPRVQPRRRSACQATCSARKVEMK